MNFIGAISSWLPRNPRADVDGLPPLLIAEIRAGASPLEALTRTITDRLDEMLVRGRRLQMADYMQSLPTGSELRQNLERNARAVGHAHLGAYIDSTILEHGTYMLGDMIGVAALAFGYAFDLATAGRKGHPYNELQVMKFDSLEGAMWEPYRFLLVLVGEHIDVLLPSPAEVGSRCESQPPYLHPHSL